MKAHFDKPENCPAYNFYKAEEDIRYLLKDQKENLNEYEIYELNKVLIDLKEGSALNITNAHTNKA